jgi:hypothetical protein
MQMPNPSGKVDIMRLSYNVMRNLKKEEEEGLNQREEQIDESEKINVKYSDKGMTSAFAGSSAANDMMTGVSSGGKQN